MITLETAMSVTSFPEELTDIIQRQGGVPADHVQRRPERSLAEEIKGGPMAIYAWKGKNRYGDAVGGERRRELAAGADPGPAAGADRGRPRSRAKRERLQIPFLKREKVKLKELAVYSRQLSVLIDAELPLIQSLNILAEQTRNKYFKKVIIQVREDVEAGSSLNQAKRKFPKVFDDLYCNLIASGEQSGSLDTMLQRLAEYIERIVKLRAQVRQAMIYPSAIMIFAILVAIFLLWKVIPIFRLDLPGARRAAALHHPGRHQAEQFHPNYILFVFLGLIAARLPLPLLPEDAAGAVDGGPDHRSGCPLFGKLLSKVAISRVTRTLSTLLAGGVSMLESLKITAPTAGNVIIEKSVMDARRRCPKAGA